MVKTSYFLDIADQAVDITDEQYIILINRLDEKHISYKENNDISYEGELKVVERFIQIPVSYCVDVVTLLLDYIEKNTEI